MKKENVIRNKSFAFAVRIVNLYKYLVEEKNEYVMAKQLLRSGTSVGAMVREAEHAESKNDFIHKFKIAAKECDETIYWLEICKEIDSYPFNPELIDQIEIISKIINKIISSSKNKT